MSKGISPRCLAIKITVNFVLLFHLSGHEDFWNSRQLTTFQHQDESPLDWKCFWFWCFQFMVSHWIGIGLGNLKIRGFNSVSHAYSLFSVLSSFCKHKAVACKKFTPFYFPCSLFILLHKDNIAWKQSGATLKKTSLCL